MTVSASASVPVPSPAPAPAVDFILGLDLGQTSDPSALAVVRRVALARDDGSPLRNDRGRPAYAYTVAHLERFPLGTPYPRIVESVGGLLRSPEVQGCDRASPPVLGIDATGVGRAVVDMFLDAALPCELHPVTITAGEGEGRRARWYDAGDWPHGPWSYWVPKLQLAGAVQAGLSSGRLKVVPSLALADVLKKELLDFQVKITGGAHTQLGAWREGAHDDLVLAVAVACWLGENLPGPPPCLHGGVSVPIGRPPSLEQRLGGGPRGWHRRDEDEDRPRRRAFYGEW